jgi:hypothetical protein
VTVELAFKPETPLNPADYAAAASAWQAAGTFPLSVDVCGCTTSCTVTDTASGYDIEPAASSSGKKAQLKKAKKCKGAFTPPKSGKAERVSQRRKVGATSAASTTSVATVGVAAVVVVAVVVVLVGIKRRLRSPTLATAALATDSSLQSTVV